MSVNRRAPERNPLRDVRPIEIIAFENGAPVLDYELRTRSLHAGPGCYDLFFHSQAPNPAEAELTYQFRRHASALSASEAPSN